MTVFAVARAIPLAEEITRHLRCNFIIAPPSSTELATNSEVQRIVLDAIAAYAKGAELVEEGKMEGAA